MSKTRNWVLIRGLIRGNFHWHSFPSKLASAFPEDKIHLFELPGNGERNKEMSPRHLSEFTEDIRYQARNLERIHIVSVSLGGMVTLDWLATFPHEVEHAFVINTSLGDSGPFYKRLNYLTYPKVFTSIFSNPSERERIILELTSNNLKLHSEVLPKNIAWAQKFPVQYSNFFRQMMAASHSRFQSRISNFKNLHFIVSANDRLVHCDNTLNLCEKLKLKPKIHQWAGHDLSLDDPDFLVQHCVEKLTSASP